MPKLTIRPIELADARLFIARHHRHHTPPRFHKFSIGVVDSHDGTLVGVLVASRPVARLTDQEAVLEISRVATDGTPNACSMLYGAAARAAKAMGFEKIQTFILENEDAGSLRASGWTLEDAHCGGDAWQHRAGRKPTPPGYRKRYARTLNPGWPRKPLGPSKRQGPVQTQLPL